MTDAVTVHEGVTYAEREAGEMKLDLYLPDSEDPSLVVYFHGGGWTWETRSNIPEPERYAAELDCAIASVSYRLQDVPAETAAAMEIDPQNSTPRGSFPDHFVDAKAAIRWLRAHADRYGYNAEEIAAWGASAGGHLALLAGVVNDVTDLGDAFKSEVTKIVAPRQSGAVQAVVSWYGVTDFELVDDGAELISILLGGPREEHPERYAQASPVTHVTSESPPALLMHGREDDVVDVVHSRRFYDALDSAGVDSTRYELHNLHHVWAQSANEIQSERGAMDRLTAEPRPDQSVYEATHVSDETVKPLVPDLRPAGPDVIRQFLDRTVR